VRQWSFQHERWLRVHSVAEPERHPQLHVGEAAAIALVRQIGADRILIDDRAGRDYASKLGIGILGTLGVLELAATQNLIEIHPALAKLAATNFRITPALVRATLSRVEARSRKRT
jgi:predicted nucleic acid-binding protein